MNAELSDTSPMPFGQHRGTPMQDVPASYLHYLFTMGLNNNNSNDSRGQVANYIRKNLDALKQEYPDGIWK